MPAGCILPLRRSHLIYTGFCNEVGGEIVAYKFQNQTRYTDSNTVLKPRSSERHDYVLTKHLKSQYSSLNEYTLHNSVTVIVTPCDGVDSPTSADSTAQFVDGKPTGTDDYGALWDKIPVLFQSAKYGLTTSDYLSEFKRGDLERIDGLEFYSRTGGYFDLFASGFGAGNPAFANKGEMVYSVYDNQLYLNATEADVINGTATPLEYSDYDIKSVKVSASLYDGIYVENIGHYTTDNSKPIDRPVQIFAYVSGEYVRIADYSPVTKEFSNVVSSYAHVNAESDSSLDLADGVDGVGAKVTAPAYTCDIYLYPSVTLFRTENVLNKVGTNPLARLGFYANHKIIGTFSAFFDSLQDCFPFSRHFRGFYFIRNSRNQIYTLFGRNKLFDKDSVGIFRY